MNQYNQFQQNWKLIVISLFIILFLLFNIHFKKKIFYIHILNKKACKMDAS